MSESDIVRSICQYFAIKKYLYWRQNTTGMYRHDIGKYIPVANSMRGLPDIFLVRKNLITVENDKLEKFLVFTATKIYAIECKWKTGKQSSDQKEFQIRWEQEGGIYILARHVDDVINSGL